jgi:hypothetical protein
MNPVCKSCQNPIAPTFFFCPYCGKKLRQPPLSISVWKQINVYFISVFFPPFGLIPGIRYLRQSDSRSQMIGIIVLLLTGLSTLVTIYYSVVLIQYANQYFSQTLNAPLGIDSGMGSLNGL